MLYGSVTCDEQETFLTVTSNGIPNTDAYVDPQPIRNLLSEVAPSMITTQSYSWTIPCSPTGNSVSSTLPQGMVGFARNGVPIYNALNSLGQDMVSGATKDKTVYKPTDLCYGSLTPKGRYYYSMIWAKSGCLYSTLEPGNPFSVVGYALDA